MTKTIANKLSKGIRKGIGFGAVTLFSCLPLKSDADFLNVGIVPGNSDIGSTEMTISYKSEGRPSSDKNDVLWDDNLNLFEGNNQFLRIFSDKANEVYADPHFEVGYEMNIDNRKLSGREPFPLRFDAFATEDSAEGIFSSEENYIKFNNEGWNLDGSGIKDFAYDLKVWGNNDESNPYFSESTENNGLGVRWLIENNGGKMLGNFNLFDIEALTDGSRSLRGSPDYGSLTLYPSEEFIPEPGTLSLLGLAGAGLSVLTGRAKSRRKYS